MKGAFLLCFFRFDPILCQIFVRKLTNILNSEQEAI